MDIRNLHKNIFGISFLTALSLTLLACGGGGGGGGGSSYPNISYTGATNKATVTESNAKDFPVTALEGSSTSSDANPFPIAAVIDGSTSGNAQHTAMLNILAEQIKNDFIKQQSSSNSNTVSAVSQTIPGNCSPNPGSFTIDDNSSQTSINATYTYDNFCFSFSGVEIVQHGRVNVSGSYSTNPLILNTISVSIEYMKLTVRDGTNTYSEEFSGSMTITFDGTVDNTLTGFTVSTNFQANGLTYKIVNLEVNTLSGLNISGRFYHPTHGYVDFTTPTNFILVSTTPDKYCGGSLQLTGANGDVIDFTDTSGNCSTYEVCVTPFGGSPNCQTLTWP